MFRIFSFLLLMFFCCDVFASVDCSRFRFDPYIGVHIIDTSKVNIQQSKENLVGKMGYLESGISYNAQYTMLPIPVKNGFCLSLRSVDVYIQFPDFNIIIDKRLKENSCAYNVVLKHEQDHMVSEKEVIYSNSENIKVSVLGAAWSIDPKFVKNNEELEKYKESVYDLLMKHKDVVDIIDKIKTQIQNVNEDIDLRGDSYELWKCEDFFEEMKNSSDKMSID